MPITSSNAAALEALRLLTEIKPENYDGTELGRIKVLVNWLGDCSDNAIYKTGYDLLIGKEKLLEGALQRRGEYIGAQFPSLLGKKAILFVIPNPGMWYHFAAQFDDVSTGYGFGWHRFNKEDFKVLT